MGAVTRDAVTMAWEILDMPTEQASERSLN
jgi:hypothetical protein